MRAELQAVENHDFDLVVGTQLVAKGHNFPHLTLVGVVDADIGLANGDPRAAERTFQLLNQVAGRAGRGEKPGRALLQTWQKEHPVLRAMLSGDFERFYREETQARRDAGLPPFGRLAAIIVSGPDRAATEIYARELARGAQLARGENGSPEFRNRRARSGRGAARNVAGKKPFPPARQGPAPRGSARFPAPRAGGGAQGRRGRAGRRGRRSAEFSLRTFSGIPFVNYPKALLSPRRSGLRRVAPYVTSAAPFGETGFATLRFQPVQPLKMIRRFALDRLRANGRPIQRELFRVAEVDDSNNPTSGVAERYAQALFTLAQEQNVTDAVADALRNFGGMIDQSADLKRLVLSPAFTAEEQQKAVGAVLSQFGFGGITANFIKLVASKRRLFVLPDMIRAFLALNDKAKGVERADVTVAAPLSSDQSAALQETLRQVSGGQTVKVNVNVDPSIIGGIVVKLGSRMVDASLKTKLNSLRTRMKEVG